MKNPVVVVRRTWTGHLAWIGQNAADEVAPGTPTGDRRATPLGALPDSMDDKCADNGSIGWPGTHVVWHAISTNW